MPRFFLTVFLIEVGLVIVALISCLSAEKGQVHRLPRAAWVAIILLVPLAGPISYLLAGRPGAAPDSWASATHPPRIVAPDDDPDFLRKLDESRKSGEDLSRKDEKPPTDG